MDCHLSYNVSAPPRHYKNDNPSRFIYKNDIVIKTTIAYNIEIHIITIKTFQFGILVLINNEIFKMLDVKGTKRTFQNPIKNIYDIVFNNKA